MRTTTFSAAPQSWRRYVIAGLLLIAVQSVPSVGAQQPVRQSPESDITICTITDRNTKNNTCVCGSGN
ncbi:MAG TPA: hypothetical protein VGV87_30940 [Blastocatellia bacterium]|nr:hypothetical protein [Blastocatellia bacterium]